MQPNDRQRYQEAIGALAHDVFSLAERKGWWDRLDSIPRDWVINQKLLMAHTEISEAVEYLRRPDSDMTDAQFLEELADVLLRILDIAGYAAPEEFGNRLLEKMAVNESRAYRHGMKF